MARTRKTSLTTIEAPATSSGRAERSPRRSAAAPPRDATPLPESVLVIDDSASDRRLLAELLKELRSDIVVATAASLAEARQVLADATFDIILLDLGLSDAKELEGLLVLADLESTTPIVVVTAHPNESYVYAALNSGADEYLNKSDLSADRVRDALQRAVYRRTGRRRYDRLGKVTQRSLNSLSSSAATLEVTGRISAVNEAWEEFARNGGASVRSTGVGVNYLTVCRQAAGDFAEGAHDVANGIEAVLNGEREKFTYDYPCPDNGEERWFTLRAVPLRLRGGGAVVTHTNITDVTRTENDLRRRESKLESSNELSLAFLHAHSAQVYALVSAEGEILHRSMSTYQLLGNEPLNGLSAPVLRRVDPADETTATQVFARVASTPFSSEQLLVRVVDRLGGHRTLDLTLTNLLSDPAVKAIVVSGNDITKGRYFQIAERIESRLLRILPAAVVVTDYSGTVVYWNDNATQLYGHTSHDALGKNARELKLRPESLVTVDAVVMTSGRWEGDYTATRADRTSVPVHTIVERIDDPDIDFQGIISASIDVSDRQRLEEALEFQSRHDVLTRVPNRELFVEHLSSELATRHPGAPPLGLLVADIDDFRKVNDQFGFAVGDDALKAWVKLVTDRLTTGDLLARSSGNKFLVCGSSLTTVEDALDAAHQLCDATSMPLLVGDQSVAVTVSVGVAMSGPDSTAEGLIRNADVALYSAKASGPASVEVFDDTFHDEVQTRNTLRTELARAVADEAIEAYFQPVVDLTSGEIMGFEALARWHHGDRGEIPPDEFIPLAEQSGLIGKLGISMLEQSCRALLGWNDVRPGRRTQVAVNVSPQQLTDPLFPEAVRETCARFDVNNEDICLEITESALENEAVAFHALNELRAVGVRIAIDDFGTGYSSLRRLNRYPLDFLKIDQSFVSELSAAHRDSVIITAVAGLADALGFETVAEGIETETQRRRLLEMGCAVGQGYLFSQGVPLADATALIAGRTTYPLEAAS